MQTSLFTFHTKSIFHTIRGYKIINQHAPLIIHNS